MGDPFAKYPRTWFRSAAGKVRVPIAEAQLLQLDAPDFRMRARMAFRPKV